MGTRAVAVAAAAGAAGMSGEAGLAGVPRLLEDLARLSEDKDSADIVFLLGRDETPVYAHRIILQARSVLTSHYLWKHINSVLNLKRSKRIGSLWDIFLKNYVSSEWNS